MISKTFSAGTVIDSAWLNDVNTRTIYLTGSTTYDPPSLAAGIGTTTTINITGAALGDFCSVSFSLDTQGIVLYAWVSAANTVSVRFQNGTSGGIDLASGTILVRVSKQ